MVTLEQYLTSDGTYPERAKDPALNMGMIKNANIYLDKINPLFDELGIRPRLSSGYRTVAANEETANAAAHSNHEKCAAGDWEDDENQTLGNKLQKDFEDNGDNSLLVKYGLYMEQLSSTRGKHTNWVHLQFPVTHNRIFVP